MSKTVSFQQAIEYIEALSSEDQDLLIEIIKKRRIEKRRAEIAQNAAQTLAEVAARTAKRGTFADLRADLIEEE